MKCIFLVCCCIIAYFTITAAPADEKIFSSSTPYRYDGAQLWKLNVNNELARVKVFALKEKFDIDIWNSDKSTVDIFLEKSTIETGVADILNGANISYSILIEDIQKGIDDEKPLQIAARGTHNKADHPLTWTAYHRLDDIYAFIEHLAKKYPGYCEIITIGNSTEKRLLKVLKLSNKNPKNKAIWVDGGIHAREWISPASVTYFINDLVLNWDKQPEHVKNINWYIQPVVNPDGYEYSHSTKRFWRKNRRDSQSKCPGVDLNRNFGYRWGGIGSSDNPCSEIYRGLSAFSEPESAAQRDFFKSSKENFQGFFSFHSYGQYILYPWGYDSILPEDHEDLNNLGTIAARNMKRLDQKTYSVGSSATLLSPAAGGSDDYGKSIGIKYSYTIELGDTGNHGFVLPTELIIPTAKEAQEFLKTAAQIIYKN